MRLSVVVPFSVSPDMVSEAASEVPSGPVMGVVVSVVRIVDDSVPVAPISPLLVQAVQDVPIKPTIDSTRAIASTLPAFFEPVIFILSVVRAFLRLRIMRSVPRGLTHKTCAAQLFRRLRILSRHPSVCVAAPRPRSRRFEVVRSVSRYADLRIVRSSSVHSMGRFAQITLGKFFEKWLRPLSEKFNNSCILDFAKKGT